MISDYGFLRANLEKRGFETSLFSTAQEAADYLDGKIDGKTVGAGGSQTMLQMGLLERLQTHNTVHCHRLGGNMADAAAAQIYLSSVNGLAETGEIINIDGVGNRVASTIYGHEEVYLIVGKNKIARDYDGALWRARHIASPKNARRLDKKTPCAAKADRCYDCDSPDRICNALVVFWRKPTGTGRCEVVLVDEPLGF